MSFTNFLKSRTVFSESSHHPKIDLWTLIRKLAHNCGAEPKPRGFEANKKLKQTIAKSSTT